MIPERSAQRVKICRRCKAAKVRPSWTCRGCGAICCEHLCGLKSMSSGGDGKFTAIASCSVCRLRKK